MSQSYSRRWIESRKLENFRIGAFFFLGDSLRLWVLGRAFEGLEVGIASKRGPSVEIVAQPGWLYRFIHTLAHNVDLTSVSIL